MHKTVYLDCVASLRLGFSESAESPKMELTPLTPESAVSAGCFKAKRRACLKPHTNHTGKQEPRAPRRALRPSGPDKLPSRHARTRAPARAHPHGTAISAARQSSRPASPDAHGRPRHTPAKKSPRRAASPRPSLRRAHPAAASAAATVPPRVLYTPHKYARMSTRTRKRVHAPPSLILAPLGTHATE